MSEKDQVKKTTTSTKEKANVAKKEEHLIYCGPNLPKAALNQFTIFKNGIPKHLDKQLEDCKIINKLFVPVNQFASKWETIQTNGTPENTWYKQVTDHFYGGAK